MGGYYLCQFYGSYVRKVLVVYTVVEQLEIGEALRDWCGELPELSARREHRNESTWVLSAIEFSIFTVFVLSLSFSQL